MFLVGSVVKNLPTKQETRVRSLCQEDPLEKEMQPTPVFLPGKSHGQSNLVGHDPWGHKEQTQLSDSACTTTHEEGVSLPNVYYNI